MSTLFIVVLIMLVVLGLLTWLVLSMLPIDKNTKLVILLVVLFITSLVVNVLCLSGYLPHQAQVSQNNERSQKTAISLVV